MMVLLLLYTFAATFKLGTLYRRLYFLIRMDRILAFAKFLTKLYVADKFDCSSDELLYNNFLLCASPNVIVDF